MTIPFNSDLSLEAEVAPYSQVGGAFVEIDGRGYRRMPYAREVTFQAIGDWEPITHVATIVRGEVLLRPATPKRLCAGQTLTVTFSGTTPFQRAGYVVGPWAIESN
jgi:hypothetical protein